MASAEKEKEKETKPWPAKTLFPPGFRSTSKKSRWSLPESDHLLITGFNEASQYRQFKIYYCEKLHSLGCDAALKECDAGGEKRAQAWQELENEDSWKPFLLSEHRFPDANKPAWAASFPFWIKFEKTAIEYTFSNWLANKNKSRKKRKSEASFVEDHEDEEENDLGEEGHDVANEDERWLDQLAASTYNGVPIWSGKVESDVQRIMHRVKERQEADMRALKTLQQTMEASHQAADQDLRELAGMVDGTYLTTEE